MGSNQLKEISPCLMGTLKGKGFCELYPIRQDQVADKIGCDNVGF